MYYKDYLKSKDWLKKRIKKYSAKNRCAICGSQRKLNVHHLIYGSDLTKIEQKDLRVLCERCHSLTHKLFNEGRIIFKSTNHNSRFATIKNIVKKERKKNIL